MCVHVTNHCYPVIRHCHHASVCSVCGYCLNCGTYVGFTHHCHPSPWVWPPPNFIPSWVNYNSNICNTSPVRDTVNALAGAGRKR